MQRAASIGWRPVLGQLAAACATLSVGSDHHALPTIDRRILRPSRHQSPPPISIRPAAPGSRDRVGAWRADPAQPRRHGNGRFRYLRCVRLVRIDGRYLAQRAACVSQGANKLGKLARAIAAERHLVVVLDEFSAPRLGICIELISLHEGGAAGYVMSSVEPPVPLTHLCLIPRVAAREGPAWTREAGWDAPFFGRTNAVCHRPIHDPRSGSPGAAAPPPTSRVRV
jgi:hypothetical protein